MVLVQGFEEVFASLGSQPSAESSLILSIFLKRIQKITEIFLRTPGLENARSPTLWTACLPFWPLPAPASPPHPAASPPTASTTRIWSLCSLPECCFLMASSQRAVLVVSVSVSARPYLTWLTPTSQFVAELCSSLLTFFNWRSAE